MPTNSRGIGTTRFFFIPNGAPHTYAHGDYYFLVKNYLSRVNLANIGWWSDVTSVALATGAKATGGAEGAAKSINQAVRVNHGIPNTTISCAKNIVDIVPATMQQFSIEAQLVATRRDPVADFMGLVQTEAFATALSFAPGPLATLKALAPVVPGLLKVFGGESPKEEPALNASEDFTLTVNPIQPGYLVVLAAMGNNTELNQDISEADIQVTPTNVLLKGSPVDQASYVVLQFEVIHVRGTGGTDSQWVALYEKINQSLDDLSVGIGDRTSVLDTALKGLYAVSEMQAADNTFTKTEMAVCRQKLRDKYGVVSGAAHPMNVINDVSPSLEANLTHEELRTRSNNFETEIQNSMQRLASFNS